MFDLNSFIQRLKRRKHEPTFLATLDELNRFKALIAKQKCPRCSKNGLLMKTFSRNPIGWSTEVECDNCNFEGVVNSEGFDFSGVDSKGKARD